MKALQTFCKEQNSYYLFDLIQFCNCEYDETPDYYADNRDFAFFFVFERTKHQPRHNLRSYLVLQRPCNEAELSPGIDAFWY